MQNFRALGAPPPDPRASGGWGLVPRPPASGGWGLCPQTPIGLRRLGAWPPDPQTAPLFRISGYAPALKYVIARHNTPSTDQQRALTWTKTKCKTDHIATSQTQNKPIFD